jgi:hypothetical protein
VKFFLPDLQSVVLTAKIVNFQEWVTENRDFWIEKRDKEPMNANAFTVCSFEKRSRSLGVEMQRTTESSNN